MKIAAIETNLCRETLYQAYEGDTKPEISVLHQLQEKK